MTSTRGIRAGRAFVELFADDSKLVRGLRRAQKKLKAFGSSIEALETGFRRMQRSIYDGGRMTALSSPW